MSKAKNLKFKLYKFRQSWRKQRRTWFPSPAEVEFMRIMGSKYITLSWITDPRTKFPLTWEFRKGKFFKREGLSREVRVGSMYIDFATTGLRYAKGIEIDGRLFHQDIVHEIERDEYVAGYGYELLHIPAAELYRDASRVQQKVIKFLAT